MKERPILFSGPMVRAILEGRKWQTRRLLDPKTEAWLPTLSSLDVVRHAHNGLSPRYGYQGDRLWVRETFCVESNFGLGTYAPPFSDGRPVRNFNDEEYGEWWEQCHYEATDPKPYLVDHTEKIVGWKPSIHMPRWASRILLEVTDVRIERLQDISREDALYEGVRYSEAFGGYVTDDEGRNFHHSDPVQSFCKLWCSIHGPESWDANPWVWVISFQKLDLK